MNKNGKIDFLIFLLLTGRKFKAIYSTSKSKSPFDEELIVGEPEFPILIIGTKLDLIKKFDSIGPGAAKFSSPIAAKFRCDEFRLNSYDPKFLAAGSTNSLKLSRFFDQVIQKQFYSNFIGKNTRKFL